VGKIEMPIKRVTREDPPYEINGKEIPVIGKIPKFMPIFIDI